MYKYYILISLSSFFLNYSFSVIVNEDLVPPAQCYLPSHPSVLYSCLDVGRVEGSRECEKYENNGTVVRPQCRSPYYYSAIALTHMQCIDGDWNYTAKCTQVCGKVSSSGTPLAIGGEPAKIAEVPWHAGIYTKTSRPYRQKCGGTLISDNIVLSAAHCFWDGLLYDNLPAADFAVAVGKLYRPWSNDKDKDNAQRSNVTAIYLSPFFQGGLTNFREDIAVVVVTTPFKFTTFVRPVCVDFDQFLQNIQLKAGKMGKVAGWGLTAVNGAPSQILRVVDLPYVDPDTCKNESPADFRGYVTSDKFCAGFKNEQKALCTGDSGGGLAFPELERDVPRFYLRGIVSTAAINKDKCNANVYMTFTQILKYEDFITQFWKPVELPCKEESFGNDYYFSPHYSMNSRSLNYVSRKRDSAGLLKYFEMHVAIKADEDVRIILNDKTSFAQVEYLIIVGRSGNQYTELFHPGEPVQRVHTPDILSNTQFRTFYVKINDGKLEFGKEGVGSPLASITGADLRSVSYFAFGYTGNNKAKIRYDCPYVLGSS